MVFAEWKHHDKVRDEHFEVSPDVQGRPLASPQRRALAFLLDNFFFMLLAIPWGLFLIVVSLWIQAPDLAHSIFGGREQDSDETLEFQLLELIARRKPELLAEDVREALETGNQALVSERFDGYDTVFALSGGNDPTRIDHEARNIHVRDDVILGPVGSFFGILSLFLTYFTLSTARFSGYTPAKRLCGIRVVRLDGKKLSLWDCFGRAGGYSASFSTFGLGFLDILWQPNRQTLHDRISATVVIRNT